jgi:hypothetical protein
VKAAAKADNRAAARVNKAAAKADNRAAARVNKAVGFESNCYSDGGPLFI